MTEPKGFVTRAERRTLDRIAAGLLPMTKNNPTCRALIRKLEDDGFCRWTPKGWTLTDVGRAVVS